MSLTSGTRLGSDEVVSVLGAGGKSYCFLGTFASDIAAL